MFDRDQKQPRLSRAAKRSLKTSLVSWLGSCDDTVVQIYGPYAPCKGRSRWRLQVYDPATRRKLSVTAATQREALILKAQLENEIKVAQPLTVWTVLEDYLEHKRTVTAHESSVKAIGRKLRQLIPDVPVVSITRVKANEYYLAETKRVVRSGRVQSAATHQGLLRLAKEFWRWLVRRELAQTNPWAEVEPIGRAKSGKVQPVETDARSLDRFLFERASAGDEGALAILVQLYLGLRPSEVLALTVGACSGDAVYVPGTKTKNARRKLELYAPVAELLRQHCGSRPSTERVFAANLPKQPASDWMYKRLHRYCDDAGIPRICPHALRGLHSSLALSAGATTHDVAQALGHASFSTTQRHYATPESISVGRSRNFVKAMQGPSAAVQALLSALPDDLRGQVVTALKGSGHS